MKSALVKYGKSVIAFVLALSFLSLGGGQSALAVVSPPADSTATRAGTESIEVTWEAVEDAIGFIVVPVVSGVEVESLEVRLSGDQTGHLFVSLNNGTTYTFRVRAVSAEGVSDPVTSNAVTAAGPPSEPNGVSIEPSDGQLEVSWSPSSPNGSPITEYEVVLSIGDSEEAVESTTSTTVTFGDLVNETTYTVTITARNDAGESVSTPQDATPTAGVAPPSPFDASPGVGSAVLSWTAPVQTGGQSIDFYSIEITAPVAAVASRTVAGDLETYTWTGLTGGVEHSFRIKTITEFGAASAWSVTASTTPTSATTGGGDSTDDDATAPNERIGGSDRYETATLLSEEFFEPGVEVVFLATGTGYADALAGGPATEGDGPVLLVTRDEIPSATVAELERLEPGRIVVLGGEAAVSAAVFEAARGFTTGTVSRIGGSDRYETAARLSAATFASGVGVTFLATGSGFADALSVGPAALGDGPVLLVMRDEIPSATVAELERLEPGRIVVLGGEAAVSAAVFEAARGFTTGTVSRIGGSDRYETAALISEAWFSTGVGTIFIATGLNFPDALSVGPFGGPVLLARTTCVPTSALDEIVRLNPTRIIVLGGTSALGTAVRNLTPCA